MFYDTSNSAMPKPLKRHNGDVLRSNLNYEFARIINGSFFKLFHCVRYRTSRNIPIHGPIIFAPNHVSYYDPTLVATGIPFRIRFMAWDALFKVPVLKQIMETYGAYGVKLKSADKGAIVQTLKILKHGEAVMIFPEGARSNDHRTLQPLEQGVARLALQTGAHIVPVTITGIGKAWPRSRMFPIPFIPLTVKFHPAIRPVAPEDRSQMRESIDNLNELIARPINRRLGAHTRLTDKR